ncbi:hypothetical protein [Roseateles sp. L2-2]|uniref:hypothetical protein n=1 Tax=Roseateles TaxID=93681 RepID=UPI003D35B32C
MTSFLNRLRSMFKGVAPEPARAPEPEPQPEPKGEGEACEAPLDYDKLIHLDAENLSETGILSAYMKLQPLLKQFAESPIEVIEHIDDSEPSYAISAAGKRFQVWDSGTTNVACWERATVAFFDIVNANLQTSSHKFYAFYGGNDLHGMFLTEEEFAAARRALKKRSDWPWLPVDVPPYYGYPDY